MTDDEYLTTKEVAKELRMSQRGVRNLCQSGKIGSTKISPRRYLIPRASLEEYLKIRR